MSLRSSVPYPVEIVFHPAWWFHREGITFDADFFYHPSRRVEVESVMERALWDRWGRFGLGGKDSPPQIGAVHLAAGFLMQEMLGCRVEYLESAPPLVHTGELDAPILPSTDPFHSSAFKRFDSLVENLETHYRKIQGDVNWGGVLNIAMDLRGQDIFTDLYDRPQEVQSRNRGCNQYLHEKNCCPYRNHFNICEQDGPAFRRTGFPALRMQPHDDSRKYV